MNNKVTPTHKERSLHDDDFIVSKTDLKGRILYGNRIFIELSGYSEHELLNSQHNVVRHPDIPRGIFQLMWNMLSKKKEMFAYLKNMSKDGGFYWTFGHVTPSYDDRGNVTGYYSVRRKPKAEAISVITDLYRAMLEQERKAGAQDAPNASLNYLNQFLEQRGESYEEFILSL
ncbi:MAG: PAS domain-containing protein [Sulfuricella denitrificans]|nr:PAS domain-containing protein [Sulfuricella denitrificans]